VIVHAGADDYSSQPSGEAGDRIACGVLETYREAAEGTA
jgi:Cu-Zn family superoxide dismutase